MNASNITSVNSTICTHLNCTISKDEALSAALLVPFTIYYALVFVTAVVGNTLVITAVVMYARMRTVMNIYILNLAISDLLFALLSLFDAVTFILGGWYAGESTCKLQSFLIEVCYTSSVITLMVMSFERYCAICHPTRFKEVDKSTYGIIVVTWIFSIAFCTILLYAYQVRNSKDGPICASTVWPISWKRSFYTIHSVVVYIIPIVLMILSHYKISREISKHRIDSVIGKGSRKQTGAARKRRAVKMLITVIVTFFMLWTMFIIARLLMYYGYDVNVWLWKAAQLLILSSTAVNSIIYAFMSPKFSRCFKELLLKRPCCNKGKVSTSRNVSTTDSQDGHRVLGKSLSRTRFFDSVLQMNSPVSPRAHPKLSHTTSTTSVLSVA